MINSSLKKLLSASIAIILLLVIIAWLAGAFQTKIPANQIIEPTQTNTQQNTYTVKYTDELILEPIAATLAAKQTSIIASRLLGTVETVKIRAGDIVKQDQLLVKLNNTELTAQVEQARQQVKAITARSLEAKSNLERANKLFKQQLISSYQLEQNQTQYQALTAELSLAQQQLKQSQTILQYSQITAPINGRVVDRFVEPGNTVQPGTKLLTIYNPLSIRAEAQVREQLALKLELGQQLSLEIPSTQQTLKATIEEIVPAANTNAHSFLVKVAISPSNGLLPGMYARLLIPEETRQILYLPQDYISQVGQLHFAWVIVNGIKQRRFIRIGKANNRGLVEVISGVKVGEHVVRA